MGSQDRSVGAYLDISSGLIAEITHVSSHAQDEPEKCSRHAFPDPSSSYNRVQTTVVRILTGLPRYPGQRTQHQR